MENYEIASFDSELYHWGIKGMKWGVRRYQNKDGSLTAAGQKHRTLRETIHDHKVAKKRKAAAAKARATKEAKKAEEEKAKVAAEKRAKDVAAGKISAKKMTDEELQKSLTRLQNEQKYKEAVLETRPMRKLMNQAWDKAVVPALTESGKELLKKTLNKYGEEVLGLNEKEAKSAYEQLKEAKEMSDWKKQIAKNDDWHKTRNLELESEKAKLKSTIEKNKVATVKYQKELNKESGKEDLAAKAKAQKEVDDYNAQQEKAYQESKQTEPRHQKGAGGSTSNSTDNVSSGNKYPSTKVDWDISSNTTKQKASTGKDYFNNFKKGADTIIDVYVDSNGRAHEAGEQYVAGLLEDKKR